MILTLFFLTLYFWKFSSEQGGKNSIDLLKIRQGAPQREVKRQVIKEFHNPDLQKIKANHKKNDELVEITSEVSRDEVSDNHLEDDSDHSYHDDEENSDEYSRKMAGAPSDDQPLEESIVENNHDANLNTEIGELLGHLDPEYGEEIFENFNREKEAYRSQLEDLARNDDGTMDMESIIRQLEMQHEEKMHDILGPYYQVVKEQYSNFLENIPQ